MTTDNNLAVVDWEAHNPPTDLIFDDGEVLESNRHRIAIECPHSFVAADLV